MSDKIFPEGFIFKQKRDNAPEWVLGSIAIKVDEATEWLKDNQKNGWVNLDLKESQGGKTYLELDTWVPQPQGGQHQAPEAGDVPF